MPGHGRLRPELRYRILRPGRLQGARAHDARRAHRQQSLERVAGRPGGEGEPVQTIYRFFYKSAGAPKLDEGMCKKAMGILTESACQGKGGNGDSTRGGEIRIGGDDDYIQIGFDPNDV